MTAERNVAVLVGNGLSIAFNPELNLQRITEEVLQRIEKSEGGDVVVASWSSSLTRLETNRRISCGLRNIFGNTIPRSR